MIQTLMVLLVTSVFCVGKLTTERATLKIIWRIFIFPEPFLMTANIVNQHFLPRICCTSMYTKCIRLFKTNCFYPIKF